MCQICLEPESASGANECAEHSVIGGVVSCSKRPCEIDRVVGQDFVTCCACESSLVRYVAVIGAGVVGSGSRKRRAVKHVVVGNGGGRNALDLIRERAAAE